MGEIIGTILGIAVLCLIVSFAVSLIRGENNPTGFIGVKVIKRGSLSKKQVECPSCHSVLEYTVRNVWYGGTDLDGKHLCHYIKCPVCRENVLVYKEERKETNNENSWPATQGDVV